MNMNKIFKNIMLAAVAVLSMTTFAACSSDDDPKGEEKTKSGKFVYNYYLCDEIFKVANVTISYADCNGSETTETITADKCSKDIPSQYAAYGVNMCYNKEFKAASLPATSGYQVTWTRKAGELDQEKYTLSTVMYYDFKLDDGSAGNAKSIVQHFVGVKAESIDNAIDKINKTGKLTYTVGTDGVIKE